MSSSAGRVLILPKGEYNNATQYQMLDAVRYNGSLYIAKKTTIGHVPADGEYWMLSAIGASDIHWGDITGSIANQSDLINALDAKQNVLTFDTTPTSGSTNPVTSGGIHTAVQATASNLATIESSTTASRAYSTGDYLVLNGQLYEAIADIASGETLVVGTNISARTVGEELTALNNGLSTTNGNLSSLTNTVWEWETFQGTVAGVAQTFYRKRLGNVYIMFGAGSVNVAIGAGTTSQRQIVYTNKPFTAVYGGAANLSVGGQVDSHARYVSVGRDRVDAWLYNPVTTTASTIVYNFIVIGIAS